MKMIQQPVVATYTQKLRQHGWTLVNNTALGKQPQPGNILEQQHKHYAQNLLVSQDKDYRDRMRENDRKIQKLLSRLLGDSHREQIDIADKAIWTIKEKWRGKFHSLWEASKRTLCRLKSLESRYGATLEQEGESFTQLIAMVVFLLVGESLISGWSLGINSAGGWLSGVVQAFMISGLAIAISYSAGLALRAVYGRVWWRMTLFVILVVVLVSSLVSYHMVVGWMRTLLEHGDKPEAAMTTAVDFFLKYHFNLKDLMSWFLVITGLLFNVTALMAGWRTRQAKIRAQLLRAEREYLQVRKERNNAESRLKIAIEDQYDKTEKYVFNHVQDTLAAADDLRQFVADGCDIQREHGNFIHNFNLDYTASVQYLRDEYQWHCDNPESPADVDTGIESLDVSAYSLDTSTLEEAETVVARLAKVKSELGQEGVAIREVLRSAKQQAMSTTWTYILGCRSPDSQEEADTELNDFHACESQETNSLPDAQAIELKARSA